MQMLATSRKPRQLLFDVVQLFVRWRLAGGPHLPYKSLIGHAGGGACWQQLSGWGFFPRFDAQQTDLSLSPSARNENTSEPDSFSESPEHPFCVALLRFNASVKNTLLKDAVESKPKQQMHWHATKIHCWSAMCPEINSNDFGVFWNYLADSNSNFVVAKIIFLKDSNFWCVHVNVPWPVCTHAIPFRMLWCP